MAGQAISQLQAFVEASQGRSFFVGLDIHKNSYSVALRRVDGAVHTLVLSASPQALIDKLAALGITVAMAASESGPTGFHLARALTKAGIPNLVAAPSRIPRPVIWGAKTDRLDCVKLADYAAKGMLRPIAVPTEEQEAQRSLERRRHNLADDLRRVKLRIHSHLLFLGLTEPPNLKYWSKVAVASLLKLPMHQAARYTLESFVREMHAITSELSLVEQQLETICRQEEHDEVIKCLRTVPGVGPLIAATFRLELFQPERFSRAEEVTSYLGLAPMVRQSGESKGRAKLRPVGQTKLRSLLVEAAWKWRAHDPKAQAWYHKLLGKSGLAQKAITALARKLAIILWRLSLEKRVYRSEAVVA
ncbi:IS110 family transposase [Desulfovibrio sp. JY]|nr:IS110 family transposase [Desulfovibrio sp. JY]